MALIIDMEINHKEITNIEIITNISSKNNFVNIYGELAKTFRNFKEKKGEIPNNIKITITETIEIKN